MRLSTSSRGFMACSVCLLLAACGPVADDDTTDRDGGASEVTDSNVDSADSAEASSQDSYDAGFTPDLGLNDSAEVGSDGGADASSTDSGDGSVATDSGDGSVATDSGDGSVATDGGDGSVPPACAAPGGVSTSALLFDGNDDHVAMGVARTLGLRRFTVEAWVRRDGAGQATGTGVGGLALVPIAAKGRGESDGSTVDCNYAVGFHGEVLGADFEDLATGANHPVIGRTAITHGQWHHVAATFDGAAWRLYLNGRLDGQAMTSAVPRHDSIQHFGLGTTFDSRGVAAGRLHGALDEVRVWDHARTASEISGTMYQTVARASGLVGRWALDATDLGAPDSAGTNRGTIAGGARFITPGAVLDLGMPPTIGMPTPSTGMTVAAPSVLLSVNVADPDSRALAATFHIRDLTDINDFTVVVLPDTQYYTVQGAGDERFFYDQTRWIMANRGRYNIVATIHNGDIVDNAAREYQWTVADRAMRSLEARTTDLPDGMPYGVAVGNHDQTPISSTGGTASFNRFFGVSRFTGRAYWGGHYGDTNDESWFAFDAGGLDFVVLSVQFDPSQDPAVVAWARDVFLSHPRAFGVLNAHYIVGGDGGFGAQGRTLYNGLRDVDNLQLMTNGHVHGEARRSDTYMGNVIHSMLADYQSRDHGGSGWMRIWEFSPASNELTVRTYSPTLDRFETDANSEFTLPVDLSGSGGAFRVAARVDPAAVGTVSAAVSGLAPGRAYEWYVALTDCVHTTRSVVSRFRTRP